MKKYKIAVLSGDGIGPEVVAQAMKVLDAVAHRYGHHFEYCHALVGAIAIDETGDPLPQDTIDTCLASDAILFGSIGHPRYDNDPTAKVRPEQGLLKLRKTLGLYANLRPVTIYPSLRDLCPLRPERIEGVDMLIVRELTGGLYFGERGRSEDRRYAYDTCSYSWEEVERIARIGFEESRNRRRKLTLVDKANVLESSRLWREVVQAMAPEDPDVEVSYMFVDNAAMQLILYPAQFDVIITENMFGDILSRCFQCIGRVVGTVAFFFRRRAYLAI
ncbi:MAG: 3-isopropylmalate dehydrogenase [Saprospiraceae bacterium]